MRGRAELWVLTPVLATLACAPSFEEPTASTDPTDPIVPPAPMLTPEADAPDDADPRVAHPGWVPPDEPTEPTMTVACAVGSNPLRAECAVDVVPATAVSVTFEPADGSRPPRTHHSDVAASHVVPLYLMTAETDYVYTVERADGQGSATGHLTTGALPARYSELVVVGQGASTAPLIGATTPCGTAVSVIHDSAGELLWMQNMALGGGGRLEGTSFTEDRTVLSVVGLGATSMVSEVDLQGNQLMAFVEGVDYVESTHHDAFKQAGLVYALAHETIDLGGGKLVLLDGFYVFDASGVVAEWWLSDHWLPPAPLIPGSGSSQGYDLTHANAIWLDAQGDIFVSMRHINTVVKIRGMGPDFGDIVWRMAGGPTPWINDFALVDLPGERSGFQQQHNVHRTATGEFAMFDNRASWAETSRLLVFDLDQVGQRFDAVEAYDLPVFCSFQGGAWFTAAGNPIATCAPDRRGYEFQRGDPGTGTQPATPIWQAQLRCVGGANGYVPRFVPLDW